MKSKSVFLSTTFWINILSFIILWLSSQTAVVATVAGGAVLYLLNIILNMFKNNTPINPVIDLAQYGISMKMLIYFVNIGGLVVLAYQYLSSNAIINSSVWLTMVISLLTAAIRVLTTQEKRS